MDELTQHFTAIAATSDQVPVLPSGTGALTAVVAARTLLEMAEDTEAVRTNHRVAGLLETAVSACDQAALELQ